MLRDKIAKILLQYAARDYGNAVSNNFTEPVEVIATAIAKMIEKECKECKPERKR